MAALDARESQIFEVVAEKAAASFQSYAVTRLWMPAGGWFDIRSNKDLSTMELGDMAGRVEEFSVLRSREDVGDNRGVEAVRTEKLIEQ